MKKIFKIKILQCVLGALLLAPGFLHATADDLTDGDARQVAPGVYAGKGKASSGEDVYFGMELLDETNILLWHQYIRHTTFLMRYARGAIEVLSVMCQQEKREPYTDKNAQFSGFTQKEYTAYLDELEAKQFFTTKKRAVFQGIRTSISGFDGIGMSAGSYMTYASKIPVTSRRIFSEMTLQEWVSIKTYNDIYGDLIMTVGSRMFLEKDFYTNRGIFRNPSSVIEGGYKNISLLLYGFSGKALKIRAPHVRFMKVAPLRVMKKIMKKNINTDDLVHDKSPEGHGMLGIMDTPYKIKIEAVAALYCLVAIPGFDMSAKKDN